MGATAESMPCALFMAIPGSTLPGLKASACPRACIMRINPLWIAGRWRGALVAVKVVAHDCSIASLAETLRESALSTSIHHPNVVSPLPASSCRHIAGNIHRDRLQG